MNGEISTVPDNLVSYSDNCIIASSNILKDIYSYMIHCILNELDVLYCEQVLNSLNILNNLNILRLK